MEEEVGEPRARALQAVGRGLALPKVRGSVWIKTAAVALFVLCLDLGTKALAASSYELAEKDHFFFLSILHLQNPGISLGVFTQLGVLDNGLHLPVYAFVIVGALASISLLFRAADSPLFWLPVGLILGGLGNVLELLYHGYGTDFLYIPGLEGSANLADFAIFLGLALLLAIDLAKAVARLAKRNKDVATGSSLG
ncbi:MAG TPA: signal peptidase II [Solirubrobacterales bacterium]|jgi:lipoprotein signal peptidase